MVLKAVYDNPLYILSGAENFFESGVVLANP